MDQGKGVRTVPARDEAVATPLPTAAQWLWHLIAIKAKDARRPYSVGQDRFGEATMISLGSIRNSSPAVLLLGLGLAMSASATNRLPSITVHAVVSKAVVGHSESGVPIQQATLKQHVSYSDLDLTTYKGVMELRKRVHSAAREACLTLDGLYPLDDPQASTCIRKAVSNASRQVESAIGRAQRIAKGP